MPDEDQNGFQPKPAAVPKKAADIRATANEEGAVVTHSFPLKQPEEDWNDFQVGVRATTLRGCRKRLNRIAAGRFPWDDLLLGLATLSAGASLSAVVSKVSLDSGLGVLFYVVFPPVAVGSFIAYLMLRWTRKRAARDLAKDILDALPDPDRTI